MPSRNEEIGSSGLNLDLGGYVNEEFLPQLHGRQAIMAYRDMSTNDALVGGILFALDMLVRQVKWSVDPEDADPKNAEFVEQCMNDMSQSWGDLISEILSMLPYGFSFHELVYKRRRGYRRPGSKTPSSRFDDGKIGWRKIPIRSQDTLSHWVFDDSGGVSAFVQKAPPAYVDVEIGMEKGLLFRTNTYKNNPEGKSVLRNAYRAWFYKRRIEEIEGVGIERDLAGFPVIRLPSAYLSPGATAEMQSVRAAYEVIGANIRRDRQEYLMIPSDKDDSGNYVFDLTLMSSGGTRTFDTNSIIGRYNQSISMSVLADFILLGHETVGSFALSSDKSNLFAVALGTVLDVIADVFNRYAIPRLFVLNNLDTKDLPKLKHGDVETVDLSVLGTFIASLVNAGLTLFPDDDLETFVRDQAGMPAKSEEAKKAQELASQAQEATNAGGNVSGAGGPLGSGLPERPGSNPEPAAPDPFADQIRSLGSES